MLLCVLCNYISEQNVTPSLTSESLISPAMSNNVSALSVSSSMSISPESSSPTYVSSSPAQILSHSQSPVHSFSISSVSATSNQRPQLVSHSSTSLLSPAFRDSASKSPSITIRDHMLLPSSSTVGTPRHALSPSPGGNLAVTSPLNKQNEAALLNEIAGFGDCGTSPQLLSMFRVDSFKRRELDEKVFIAVHL